MCFAEKGDQETVVQDLLVQLLFFQGYKITAVSVPCVLI